MSYLFGTSSRPCTPDNSGCACTITGRTRKLHGARTVLRQAVFFSLQPRGGWGTCDSAGWCFRAPHTCTTFVPEIKTPTLSQRLHIRAGGLACACAGVWSYPTKNVCSICCMQRAAHSLSTCSHASNVAHGVASNEHTSWATAGPQHACDCESIVRVLHAQHTTSRAVCLRLFTARKL
jgi:hypothetical protein